MEQRGVRERSLPLYENSITVKSLARSSNLFSYPVRLFPISLFTSSTIGHFSFLEVVAGEDGLNMDNLIDAKLELLCLMSSFLRASGGYKI